MSSKKPAQTTSKAIRCLCGDVKATVTGVDKGAVLCHCDNCRRSSGSAFMHNYRLMKSEIKFEKGEDSVRQYKDSDTKSGGTLARHFCGKCGSPLFLKPEAFEGLTIIHCSAAQDTTQPSFELFEENKHPWIGPVAAKRASL